jgi:hypothetical protein
MSTANELLRRALDALERMEAVHSTIKDIRSFLAAEPEADEPAAWMHPNGGVIQTRLTGLDRDTYTIPLYTRPLPSRKPMTEEEIRKGYYTIPWPGYSDYEHFEAGIRFGEKHHEIGRGME